MNKTASPKKTDRWPFAIALTIGAFLGLGAIATKSDLNSNIRNPQGARNVDQALSELQETMRTIQASTFASTTSLVHIPTEAVSSDPLLEKHRENEADLEVQQIDLRLHRLNHDLMPELERLEQELLPNGVPPSLGMASHESAGTKLKQLKVIDDLRRELREKIGSLERQRATLR